MVLSPLWFLTIPAHVWDNKEVVYYVQYFQITPIFRSTHQNGDHWNHLQAGASQAPLVGYISLAPGHYQSSCSHTAKQVFTFKPNCIEVCLWGLARYSVHLIATALEKLLHSFFCCCICWTPTLQLKMTATDPSFQGFRLLVLGLCFSLYKLYRISDDLLISEQ